MPGGLGVALVIDMLRGHDRAGDARFNSMFSHYQSRPSADMLGDFQLAVDFMAKFDEGNRVKPLEYGDFLQTFPKLATGMASFVDLAHESYRPVWARWFRLFRLQHALAPPPFGPTGTQCVALACRGLWNEKPCLNMVSMLGSKGRRQLNVTGADGESHLPPLFGWDQKAMRLTTAVRPHRRKRDHPRKQLLGWGLPPMRHGERLQHRPGRRP